MQVHSLNVVYQQAPVAPVMSVSVQLRSGSLPELISSERGVQTDHVNVPAQVVHGPVYVDLVDARVVVVVVGAPGADAHIDVRHEPEIAVADRLDPAADEIGGLGRRRRGGLLERLANRGSRAPLASPLPEAEAGPESSIAARPAAAKAAGMRILHLLC